MREKKAQGEVMHLAPLGYKNTRDAVGRSIMVPDPKTYVLVQAAKRLRSEGLSIRKICRIMHRQGLRSTRGNVLSVAAMHYLLKGHPQTLHEELRM